MLKLKLQAVNKQQVLSSSLNFVLGRLIFTTSLIIVKPFPFKEKESYYYKYSPVQLSVMSIDAPGHVEFMIAAYFFIGISIGIGFKK
jgi:hypothetical protein